MHARRRGGFHPCCGVAYADILCCRSSAAARESPWTRSATISETRFADGFDRPDPVVMGLSAGPLLALLSGLVLAYLVVRLPLAGWLTVPVAVLIALTGAGAAWVRPQGRPLVEWGALAAGYALRSRTAEMSIVEVPATAAHARPEGPGARPAAAALGGAGEAAARATASIDASGARNAGSADATDGEAQAGIGGPLPTAGISEAPTAEIGGAPAMAGIGEALVLAAPRRVAFFSLAGGSGRTTLAVELACLMRARGRRGPVGLQRGGPLAGGPGPGGLTGGGPEAGGLAAGGLGPGGVDPGGPGLGGPPPEVAIIDADPMAPAVALRLGIPQPTLWEFAAARGPSGRADDRLVRHPSGVRVLPGTPRPLTIHAQLEERRALDATLAALAEAGTHLIVIDLGRDLGPMTTWGLRAADDIVIVVTPTSGGMLDAYRSTAAVRRLGHAAKIAYVLNRARAGALAGELLAEPLADLGGRLAAVVTDDPLVAEAEAIHRPVCLQTRPRAAAPGDPRMAEAGARHWASDPRMAEAGARHWAGDPRVAEAAAHQRPAAPETGRAAAGIAELAAALCARARRA